jgi:hypothetical protein
MTECLTIIAYSDIRAHELAEEQAAKAGKLKYEMRIMKTSAGTDREFLTDDICAYSSVYILFATWKDEDQPCTERLLVENAAFRAQGYQIVEYYQRPSTLDGDLSLNNVYEPADEYQVNFDEGAVDTDEGEVMDWGSADVCIPCSFRARRKIDGPHDDCLQSRYHQAADRTETTVCVQRKDDPNRPKGRHSRSSWQLHSAGPRSISYRYHSPRACFELVQLTSH